MSRRVTVRYRGHDVDIDLVTIDANGHELSASAAAAWRLMRLAAELVDVILEANTAFRSYEYQADLRRRYEAYEAYATYQSYRKSLDAWEATGKVDPEPSSAPFAPFAPFAALANKPGTSTHERGDSVDVKNAQVGGKVDLWLAANCERYGFKRDVVDAHGKLIEPWHCHYVGG